MKIRCPSCGRIGYLPDHLAPAANSLRCRKCLANFAMPEPSLQGRDSRRKDIDSWRGETVEPGIGGRSRENPALLLADGFVATYDEPDGSMRKRGPGDSQYELTIALKDEPSPSGDEWIAADGDVLEPEPPSSDELEAILSSDAAVSPYDPPFLGFIMSWLRPLAYLSVGFVALSVLVIGFLLLSSLGLLGGPSVAPATHALILASLGSVGFLLFGLWLIFLGLVLSDLALSLRRSGALHSGNERR